MKSGKSGSSSPQRPNYKTYLGNPPSITGSIYPTSIEKVPYRDPVPKVNEGINRKLYECTSGQFFSPQASPKGMYASVFEHNEAKKDYVLPTLPKQEEASPNKFRYNDFRPEPVFPNTPFKQDAPVQRSPQQLSNSYDVGYQRGSPLHNGSMSPQSYGNSPQYAPNRGEQSPQQRYPMDAREEYGYDNQRRANQTVLPEIVSPTFARSHAASRWPTLQDSAKMRNPMFSSHNFADYQKDVYLDRQRYKPQAYNYNSVEPVATKDFLKSHVSDFAHAKKYDMEQRTKIHPQLGVLGVNDNGRKSTPILKPYAPEQKSNQQYQPRQEPPRQAPEPQDNGYYSPQNQQQQQQQQEYQQYQQYLQQQDQQYQQEQEQQQQRSQQPYQEEVQQQQQVQSENLHYNRKTVENNKQPQNKTMFNPSPPPGYLTGVNRKPVMIMPAPGMKAGPGEVRQFGPYSTNYKIPSTYPW